MPFLEPPLLIRESTLFARPKIPDHYKVRLAEPEDFSFSNRFFQDCGD